jgi:hypothetical protein
MSLHVLVAVVLFSVRCSAQSSFDEQLLEKMNIFEREGLSSFCDVLSTHGTRAVISVFDSGTVNRISKWCEERELDFRLKITDANSVLKKSRTLADEQGYTGELDSKNKKQGFGGSVSR